MWQDSVPESFSVVLNMLETLGKVPLDQQLSRDPPWVGHIKAWSAELSADNPAMLVSLELVICNEAELFTRGLWHGSFWLWYGLH